MYEPEACFVNVFRCKMDDGEGTKSLLESKCSDGHTFAAMAESIAGTMFNGMSTNITREYNSKIHAGKKRTSNTTTKTTSSQKIKKLTSGGLTSVKQVANKKSTVPLRKKRSKKISK